jgi:hypothetical protein
VNKIYFKNKILNNKIYKKLNSIKKIF